MKHPFKSTFRYISCLLLSFASLLAAAATAPVNDIEMYYDVHGHGTPLVLLHGGYVDSDMWAIESWLLGFRHKVIEIDSRGHGRSTDGTGPISYEQMADDTLKLLDQLGISSAHFVGWSDGAVIASQIAATHPERVNQLVLIGAAFQGDVYVPAFSLLMGNNLLFNGFVDGLFKPKYLQVNPDPAHWPVFRDKLHALWQSPCYFAAYSPADCLTPLQSIAAPTLVVAGELEIIQESHSQQIANTIPGAEYKSVPLAGHFMPILRPFLTTNIINGFLNN